MRRMRRVPRRSTVESAKLASAALDVVASFYKRTRYASSIERCVSDCPCVECSDTWHYISPPPPPLRLWIVSLYSKHNLGSWPFDQACLDAGNNFARRGIMWLLLWNIGLRKWRLDIFFFFWPIDITSVFLFQPPLVLALMPVR